MIENFDLIYNYNPCENDYSLEYFDDFIINLEDNKKNDD